MGEVPGAGAVRSYPDRHVEFVTLRRFDAGVRRDFLAMLRGRPLEGGEAAPAPQRR